MAPTLVKTEAHERRSSKKDTDFSGISLEAGADLIISARLQKLSTNVEGQTSRRL